MAFWKSSLLFVAFCIASQVFVLYIYAPSSGASDIWWIKYPPGAFLVGGLLVLAVLCGMVALEWFLDADSGEGRWKEPFEWFAWPVTILLVPVAMHQLGIPGPRFVIAAPILIVGAIRYLSWSGEFDRLLARYVPRIL